MREMKDSGIEWIGKIPKGWKKFKIKYAYDCLDEKRIPLDASQRISGPYPYWGAGDIMDYIDGYIFDEEIVLLGEDGAPFFDKDRPVSFLVNEKVWVNNHIHVLKSHSDISAKYLMYFLNIVDYGSYINGSILNKLTQSNMDSIEFVCPTTEEQSHIADYLDKKCDEIDKLIEAKKKTNDLLKERRQSIIYEAVTKGLDPTVPMKDSGVEWIGQIPESAEVIRLKFYAYMKGRIGWQGLRAEDFIDEGPYCVTGTDFINGKINWNTCYHVSEERYEMDPYIQIKNGDLLITKDGTIGKLAKVDKLPDKACLNSHLLIIRPLKSKFTNDFLYYVLSSDIFWNYYNRISYGTIMDSISQEKMEEFSFPVYSLDTQKKIVDFLDKQSSEIDTIIKSNETTIEKLKEYRQSIIYEAVTGKVEI